VVPGLSVFLRRHVWWLCNGTTPIFRFEIQTWDPDFSGFRNKKKRSTLAGDKNLKEAAVRFIWVSAQLHRRATPTCSYLSKVQEGGHDSQLATRCE
jgi:hypothetical protein